jgi:GGDEF domain-containing protein/predicted transcriptional regulator
MNDRSFTALLVSHDRPLLRRAARFLEVCGYHVRTACRHDQATRLLAAWAPDFLVLDPGENPQAALQIARQVRERKCAGLTYTLLITNQPSVQELLEALQAGCDDFLARPIAFGEWLARMKGGARALEYERRLSAQRGIDVLTGFASREVFSAQVQDFATQASGEAVGALVLYRLDGGDALLQRPSEAAHAALIQAAERLREHAPPQSLCARWDETALAIFLPAEQEAGAAAWAESVRKQLAGPAADNATTAMTWSAGVLAGRLGEDATGWLQAGDQTIHLAGQSGGDCLTTGRQCLEENDAWSADAAAGKLFASTTARDVMSLCPFVFSRDETVETAAALLHQSSVPVAPVVDEAGNFVGTVTPSQLGAKTPADSAGRQSGSVRLLRHCASSDAPQFDEQASLIELLDYFAADPQPYGIVLSKRRPVGVIYCESLACLSEPIAAESLIPVAGEAARGEFLLVPEICEL